MNTNNINQNWAPNNNAENLFETTDKCKAKGIIESIKVPLWRDTSCMNLRIKLKWWDFGYVLYWAWDNSVCNTTLLYNLSGENRPKVWDDFYAIWTFSWVDILKIWEEAYNQNIELPNCLSGYNPEETTRDIYDNANKCQISWDIYDITKDLIEACPHYVLNMIIKSQGKLYTVFGKETVQDPLLGCLGISTNFPVHKNRWESYYPKIWDNFSAILDINSNYSILKYGEEFLNNDIPLCKGNFLSDVIEAPKETPIQKPKKEISPEIKENSSSPKVTPPTIVNEKKSDELLNTWTENIENSWSIQESTSENSSWNLTQSEIEESIENTNTSTTIKTWNIPQASIKKEDSVFFFIWWVIVFLIIIWWLTYKLYKKILKK